MFWRVHSSLVLIPPFFMSSPSTRSQFLLLLHQPDEGPGPTPEEMQQIMGRFINWIEGMRANGMVLSSNGLENSGTVLRGSRGLSATDGPYAEAKEIVGGYVLITAESFEQALEAARDCPGLDYRMAVEVRPVKLRHQEL